jgi:hypothetical protein
MQILVARWSGEYPRNTDTEPAWDTELRDDGGWLNPSIGAIMLPQGDYIAVFNAIASENLAAVTSRLYARFGISTSTSSFDTRYREDRAAGQLAPDLNLTGYIGSNPGGDAAVQLHTKFQYTNTVDIDWAFEVFVGKLN